MVNLVKLGRTMLVVLLNENYGFTSNIPEITKAGQKASDKIDEQGSVSKLACLREYKFYQTSQIRRLLLSFDGIANKKTRTWLENLEVAACEGYEKTCARLLQILNAKVHDLVNQSRRVIN